MVLGGGLLALLGAVLLLPVPELGVPLLLGGLRLLGRRYAWARRADRRVQAAWSSVRAWFHRQSAATRLAVGLLLVAAAVLLAVLAVDAVRGHL